MKRRQTYQRGSKGLLYINQGVSDNLIGFINKQTELNGVLLLGLKLVAEQYGDIDVINYVPRTFDLNSMQTIPTPPIQQMSLPTESVSAPINHEQESETLKQIQEQLSLLKAENEKLKVNQNVLLKTEQLNSAIHGDHNVANKKNLFDKDTGEDISIF